MPTDRLPAQRTEVPDMSADSIAGRRFAQSWRGYEPEEVKQFLAQVAAQVRSLRERLEAESMARRDAEQRASHPQLDEATLMTAVGDETAVILRTARSAAAEITAKAQANADNILAGAEEKASHLTIGAEELVAAKTAEAEALVAAKTAEAEALLAASAVQAHEEAERLRADAGSQAERLVADAQAQAEELSREAQRKYEEIVEGAQALREKILTDLARRRKLGTVQVEQLRAGRERLLDAYLMVRHTLDEVTDELQRADAEARAAADAVGHQGGEGAEAGLELHGDDGWEALAVFSGAPASGASGAGAKPVPVPAGGTHLPTALPPPLKAAPAPPMAAAKLASPNGSGHHPNTGAVAGEAALGGGGARDVVSGPDAIESVRILREDALTGGSEQVPAGGAPQVLEETGGEAEPAGTGAGANPDVDDLFARIRAGRAQAAGAARKALEGAGPGPSPEEVTPLDLGPNGAKGTGTAKSTGSPKQGTKSKAVPGTPAGPVESGDASGEPGAGAAAGPDDDPGRYLLRQRDEITSHLESSLARKLKRALQDEQNSLLDRLRSLKVTPTPANVLPNAEEHPDRFIEAGRPMLEEAAKAGAKLAATDMGGNPGAPGITAGMVEDLAEELGRSIAEPLRQRLELAFRAEDEETSELADSLGAAYREWKTHRIEAVARDQVTAAFSRGAYLALPEAAVLQWVVSEAEGPCPDCDDNALAGRQPKGETWPTGQLYPPAHPGCRCGLLTAQTAAASASN